MKNNQNTISLENKVQNILSLFMILYRKNKAIYARVIKLYRLSSNIYRTGWVIWGRLALRKGCISWSVSSKGIKYCYWIKLGIIFWTRLISASLIKEFVNFGSIKICIYQYHIKIGSSVRMFLLRLLYKLFKWGSVKLTRNTLNSRKLLIIIQ